MDSHSQAYFLSAAVWAINRLYNRLDNLWDNRLYNRLDNWFDNLWDNRLYNRLDKWFDNLWDNRLDNRLETGLTTGWTNVCKNVYTLQLVVQPEVFRLVRQLSAPCS